MILQMCFQAATASPENLLGMQILALQGRLAELEIGGWSRWRVGEGMDLVINVLTNTSGASDVHSSFRTTLLG